MILDQISTIIGTEIALITHLSVPNFSLIGVHVCVCGGFCKVYKRKKKPNKKLRNFGHLYLENDWSDSLQILTCGHGCNQLRDHKATYVCENCVFFFPVNIPTVWHIGFLGHTTHYHTFN